MRRALVGVLVVAAMLVVGTSTARAQTPLAQCDSVGCGGALSDPSFIFNGPLCIGSLLCTPNSGSGVMPGTIDFGVGTMMPAGAFLHL